MSVSAVSVLVPYRPDGAHRDAAWRWVSDWWADWFGQYEVVVGAPPEGPWCKAAAVADALPRSSGDVLIVADADVFVAPEHLDQTVDLVRSGHAAWAAPHRRVVRLTPAGTGRLLGGGELPAEPEARRTGLIETSHTAALGGGLVVLRRDVYERVPLDPRFVGWGQEDTSWGLALRLLGGSWWRGAASPLHHLWHPPQARVDRKVGSSAGWALYERYKRARNPDVMSALLAEIRS